ncbi:hypothetical protein FACS1894200_13270 [Spirochaetia bacterium]|nr:hypothetical protein FACS1894200_13270 [Spirochaetia bacterium]
MSTHAFTISSDKRLDCIIMPIDIRQSQSLCQKYNVKGGIIHGKALWDTGAQGSCISNRIAQTLNLTGIAQCEVDGINGTHRSDVYLVDFILPDNLDVIDVNAVAFFNTEEYDAIIGMDIITLGDFSISNLDEQTTASFRFPPQAPIDFTK